MYLATVKLGHRRLGFLPRGAKPVEECGRLARWPDHAGASVVRVGTTPPAVRHVGRRPSRPGGRLGRRGIAGDRTGHLDDRVCLSGTASRAHQLCAVQGTGLTAGVWHGGECVQMAHPAALQRGRDAME